MQEAYLELLLAGEIADPGRSLALSLARHFSPVLFWNTFNQKKEKGVLICNGFRVHNGRTGRPAARRGGRATTVEEAP